MNRNIIREYYYLTLKDIEDGATVEELEEVLYMYEVAEMYEECEGILRALKEVRSYKTIKKTIDDDTRD